MMYTSSQVKCWVITIICKCTKTILSLVVLIFCLSSLYWFLSSFFLPQLPSLLNLVVLISISILIFCLSSLPCSISYRQPLSTPVHIKWDRAAKKEKRERYDLENRILWKLQQKRRDIIWRIEYFPNPIMSAAFLTLLPIYYGNFCCL